MALVLSVLPLILTIVAGYVLVVSKMLPRDQWGGIETLSFRLLIPVVIIHAIVGSELSLSAYGALIGSLIGVLTLVGALTLVLSLFMSRETLPYPSLSTLFQTTIRWNGFIALAAAELFIGPEGLVLIAVAMAFLIPPINIANIVILSIYGTGQATPSTVIRAVVKNPLVQGCAIGLALNLSGTVLPEFAMQTLDLIGRAALGIGLMAVGAAIVPARLLRLTMPIVLGVVLRLGLCPVLFLVAAHMFGLDSVQTLAGILVLAVPAASNGYILAKQMGGDADLYADILTWQTVISMGLLPLFASVLAV